MQSQTMNLTQTDIMQYLQTSKHMTLEDLRKSLYHDGVLMKIYDNLSLLYCPFGNKVKTKLNRSVRSIIINNETRQVISHTGNEPVLNNDGVTFLLSDTYNNTYGYNKQLCYESFEGTLLTFYYNNGWGVSTRRCIDARESKYNSEKSHYDLMLEVLSVNGDTFETFTNKLDTTKSYYFILIHHETQSVIDYTSRFGENYKKLCLVGVRNSELTLDTDVSFITDTIILPPEMSLNSIYNMDDTNVYNKPTYEGIIIISFDNNNKDTIIKLQTQSYQFYNITHDNNISKGYLYLYQQNKLSSFLADQKVRCINNQKYDIISLTDSVFKVVSSELYELFKLLWDIQTGKQIQSKPHVDLYTLLPKEYKDVLYTIRGTYYSKKSEFFNKKNTKPDLSQDDYRASLLRPSDIFNILKKLNIDLLYGLLKGRLGMYNKFNIQTISDTNYNAYKLFGLCSLKCSPYYMSKCNSFISLLFTDPQFTSE